MSNLAHVDLAVIGSGPGGYRTAVLAALRGLKVALIEKHTWGGCCLNRGCVPKKAWYASARLVGAGERYARLGIAGELRADLARAWVHQAQVVAKVRSAYLDYLQRLGITTFTGSASFISTTDLAIDGIPRITAGHVVIATGAHAIAPANLPHRPGQVLTTDDLFDAAPPTGRRVAVIGSGVVATEFAFILAMLGCDVRWFGRSAALSHRSYSVPAQRLLASALQRAGIVQQRAGIQSVVYGAAGPITLNLTDGSSATVDWVLLGTGRAPHTAGLALARADVSIDAAGFIEIDDHCATTNPRILAIGDVVNARMTANLALADATVAIGNILRPGSAQRRPGGVPEVVYSAVELARLGLSEDEAEAAGFEPAIGFSAFEVNPAALGEDDAEGFVRLIADLDSGKLLGAEIVGSQAGDSIELVAQAMSSGDALRSLAAASYNHPARGEEILNAVETLASKWGMSGAIFDREPDG
jgi:dihydrolipoamide dehydrogenase